MQSAIESYAHRLHKLQLQNRISTPKRRNDEFEALFKRNVKRKIISTNMEKKTDAKAQFATFTLPHYNIQCELRFSAAKPKSIAHAAATARNLDAAIPLVICARLNCTTQKNCITLLYNTALWCTSFNAQSVSTHAKHNSTASTKKRKSHLQPSIPLRAQIKQDSIAKRRRPEPSRARDNFSPQRNLRLPEKNNVSCKSQHSNRIHDVAVAMRSAQNDLQKTIRIARQDWRTSTLRQALAQPFHCDLHRLN